MAISSHGVSVARQLFLLIFARLTSDHLSRFMFSAVPISVLIWMMCPATAAALPGLRCQLTQGKTTQVLMFKPSADPYRARAVDINGHFRFKALVFGDERKIEYIKLYAYHQSKRQAVLLHEAKYASPAVQPTLNPTPFTGVNYLYSPDLGRELQYECALIELDP